MELNEYQRHAMETCMPSCRNFSYMMLNLVGEVGEFASKVGKRIRLDEVRIAENRLTVCRVPAEEDSEETRRQILEEEDQADKALMLEAGDILWQLAGLCEVKGWTLEQVGEMNLAKLQSRKVRGRIAGEGDYR